MKQEEIEQLKKEIDEANERIEVLGDAEKIDENLLFKIFGFDYEPIEFLLRCDDEEKSDSKIMLRFHKWDDYNYYPEFPMGELFFREYLDKLRRKCIETNTWTFEEAEPEEYKEAMAAIERDKNGSEIFEYSEDPIEFRPPLIEIRSGSIRYSDYYDMNGKRKRK